MTKAQAIKAAILRAARRNPRIKAAGLREEAERGDIAAWLQLPAVRQGTFSDWTRGMLDAANALDAAEGTE
jgi:hypothetical protein